MFVVQSELTNHRYFAKVIDKTLDQSLSASVTNQEMAILYKCSNNPWINKLFCTFEDETSQVLILECLDEGTLYRKLLQTQGNK